METMETTPVVKRNKGGQRRLPIHLRKKKFHVCLRPVFHDELREHFEHHNPDLTTPFLVQLIELGWSVLKRKKQGACHD